MKVFRVVLHQEKLCLHIDSDVDWLALLSIGAMLLIQAGDPVTCPVH